MGWTISPPDGASIDANTGVATFSKNEGDSDSAYTITYTDSDGCTATTTFTVQTSPTCVGCDAGVSVSTNVDGDSTEHTTDSIGSYIVDSSRISYSGGLGWAIALFNNNKIKIKFYENTGNARSGDVIITLDGKTCKTIHVSQEAKATPSSIIAKLTLNNGNVIDIEGSGELTKSMVETYKDTTVSAEITSQCTSIGSSAFNGCSGLTSIDIPDTITSIGSYAFEKCINLETVTVEAIIPPSLGTDAFILSKSVSPYKIPIIYVPAESVDTYKSTSGWSYYASKILPITS